MSGYIAELRSQDRRMFLITSFKLLGLLVLISRLYHLQVLRHKRYTTLSDGNRIKILLEPAQRGKIVDRNKSVIAEDVYYDALVITPKLMSNFNDSIIQIGNVLELSHDVLNGLLKQKNRKIIVLKNNVSWQKIAEITNHIPDLRGISVVSLRKRYYPMGAVFAHSIGYTKAMDEVHNVPIINNAKIDVGAIGIEKTRNATLIGRAGSLTVEVNAFGHVVREMERKSSIGGEDTAVTLDVKIQEYASQLLRDMVGSIVVIDNLDGSILALSSSPSYDPNMMVAGIGQKEWDQLVGQESLPLLNRPMTRLISPASTFKLVVAISALTKRIVNMATSSVCEGSIFVGDRFFRCMSVHGKSDIKTALAKSCNVFFYDLAKNLDVDYTSQIAKKLGLGVDPSLELNSSTYTVIPTVAWKYKNFRSRWQFGDTMNYVIGHGYNVCTPIQLAIMASRLATRKKVVPTLSVPRSRPNFDDLEIDNDALDVVTDAMIKTMNMPYGTGYYASSKHDVRVIAGKTGTVQMPSKSNSIADSSVFVGFAPYNKPRYSISVLTEQVASRDTKAVYLGTAMLKFILNEFGG